MGSKIGGKVGGRASGTGSARVHSLDGFWRPAVKTLYMSMDMVKGKKVLGRVGSCLDEGLTILRSMEIH